MKRIRIVGLCLVAVFALSAVAVSSSSASNFLFKHPSGGFPVLFLSHGSALSELVTVGGQKLECSSVDNHGEILNLTLGLVLITFLGCKTKAGIFTLKCENEGAKGSGIIDVHLKFHLGKALPSGNPALLFLLPGGKFSFECEKLAKIEVKGEVIGLLLEAGKATPLKANTAYSEADLSFKQSAQGKQEDKTFYLSPGNEEMTNVHLESNLNGGAFEEAAEVTTDTIDGFSSTTITLVED